MVNNFTKLNRISRNSTCNGFLSFWARCLEFVNDCGFRLHDFFFGKQIRFARLPACFLFSDVDGNMIWIYTKSTYQYKGELRHSRQT